MKLNRQIVVIGTGCSIPVADVWLPSFQVACDKFGITSKNAIAAFLANVGVESDGLTRFIENMNYSAIGLANTWPARFAVDKSAKVKIPNATATSIARQPELIANTVYSNRMGNGPAESGDGWKYRGHGPIQLTGREKMATCGAAIGMDLLHNPSVLVQPQAGALSAAWFFSTSGCISLADKGAFEAVVTRINGAPPSDANKGPERLSRTRKALAAME